uniref:Uncharacterized protein n=1 Tax=Avena sativa TaxID=4498 RepID=A0ACD5YYF3_AVESA
MDSTSPPDKGDGCSPLNRRLCMEDVEQPIQNFDWINTLPDDLLIKILSLLTVSDAAVTSCLSSRWRHLWKNIDHLILNAHTLKMQEPKALNYHANRKFWNAEATKFVHKVNGILRNHYGNRIKEFTVRFPLTSAHASELDHWIGFATSASTEKLCLDLDDKHCKSNCLICRTGWNFASSNPYDFLFSPSTDTRGCRLSELTLSHCSLETTPNNLSGFSCLHFLSLIHVPITDAAVSDIMSNCCALQSLKLEDCDQLIHLTITHSQLLSLNFDFCNSLISVCIHADNLEKFMYKGHNVNIEYEYAPYLDNLRVYFTEKNECPLEFVSALPELPKLDMLVLQFPTRLQVQVSRSLQHTFRFSGLKAIVFILMRSWKESICSLAYLLKSVPSIEYFGLHGCTKIQEPSELNITWPEDLTLSKLYTIQIKGFSGESELMELMYFLLRRAPALETLQLDMGALDPWFVRRRKHKLQDEARCRYAREMASAHLAPKVPSTVAFTIT